MLLINSLYKFLTRNVSPAPTILFQNFIILHRLNSRKSSMWSYGSTPHTDPGLKIIRFAPHGDESGIVDSGQMVRIILSVRLAYLKIPLRILLSPVSP